MSRSDVEARLKQQAEKGLDLADRDVHDSETFDAWKSERKRWVNFTVEFLVRAFNTSRPHNEFQSAVAPPIFVGGDLGLARELESRRQDTRDGVTVLESLVDQLELLDEPVGLHASATSPKSPDPHGEGIFLVHGHDEAAKQTVARFLDRVTKPGVTILEEQADGGQTIIEKFERHAAGTGYAVVLLTRDDEGRKRGSDAALVPRARQNVILELGYFFAKLGRGRVALLYAEGVERPSDIDGILYVPLDLEGAWKAKLAREMLGAGISIDAEKVLTT